MNARNGCFGVHSSDNLVFRIMFSEISRLTFDFDAENCVQMLLRDG